jgi:hypothetical protein
LLSCIDRLANGLRARRPGVARVVYGRNYLSVDPDAAYARVASTSRKLLQQWRKENSRMQQPPMAPGAA